MADGLRKAEFGHVDTRSSRERQTLLRATVVIGRARLAKTCQCEMLFCPKAGDGSNREHECRERRSRLLALVRTIALPLVPQLVPRCGELVFVRLLQASELRGAHTLVGDFDHEIPALDDDEGTENAAFAVIAHAGAAKLRADWAVGRDSQLESFRADAPADPHKRGTRCPCTART